MDEWDGAYFSIISQKLIMETTYLNGISIIVL